MAPLKIPNPRWGPSPFPRAPAPLLHTQSHSVRPTTASPERPPGLSKFWWSSSPRAGSLSVRLGHGHARFTSNIRLRSSFAGPGEPLALNLKPYVGHPALAAIRAVRNHVPAALGLLFLLETAERLARTGPISVNHRWKQALRIPCRARALISAPHTGVGRFSLSTYCRHLDHRRIGR